MKKFERLLKGHKSLVFLDFEGTQFSHEMIAIGAVHAVIDRHGYIKKSKKPFRIYVKAHNRVGKIVTDLTGITEDMLKQKGVKHVPDSQGSGKPLFAGIAPHPYREEPYLTQGSC